MARSLILAIDQGTSSTKTIVFDKEAQLVAKATEPLKTYYLEGGLVEQEPEDIYQNVLSSVKNCLADLKTKGKRQEDIKACGISNQRETFLIWEKSGKPLYNAIVWQCKRSVEVCSRLKERGWEDVIRSKTGLIIDPYFSGTKMIWLYENVDEIKLAVDSGRAYFGTVDTWLLYKLTNGTCYLTDHTNASRTLFFNLHTLSWDEDLLAQFGLSKLNLPKVQPSSSIFGESDFNGLFNEPVKITAMIGDSHAAAFGEQCFTPGTAKATLGTGCSILMNIGSEPKASGNGMVTTVCWSMANRVDYAFEGVIVSCGATVEWLKNELGLFKDSSETEAMATAVADNNGVYIIPAFSGLGAPHWDMSRKASISGLTFDCNKNHIVRAALESIAYQIKDVIDAMNTDAGIGLQELMVNGGITSNQFVLQFLADLLKSDIINGGMPDVSALGAACLAGLKAGVYKNLAYLSTLTGTKAKLIAAGDSKQIDSYYSGWQEAINGYNNIAPQPELIINN
jgi:glycerol kinase